MKENLVIIRDNWITGNKMGTFVIKKNNLVCDICIAETAHHTAVTAAGELVRCLSVQTGKALELKVGVPKKGDICVGGKSGDCEEEELRLKVENGILWVDGGIRGILYAAYELLERLGCRFFAEDCEVLPVKEELILSAEFAVNQKPVFEFRFTDWSGANAKTAPKMRLNSLFTSIPKALGGAISYEGFVHTLGALAEMEGDYTDRQPCLTDEKTFQTVIKNLRERLKAHPDALIASVSQNDSHEWSGGCTCPNCVALDEAEESPMGSLLSFVNRVAEEMKTDYPKLAIDTLAYRYTRKPPKTLKTRENVIVRLCDIECCFSHPLDECRNAEAGSSDGMNFVESLKSWTEHSDRIYIWDYTTDFWNYHASYPNFQVLRQNLRFFADNHVKGVFEEGCAETASGEFGALRTYLLSKLLWNPYMSEETYQEHMTEFMDAYYGAGASMLRCFLERLERAVKDVHFGIGFSDPTKVYQDPDEEGTRIERAESFLKKGRQEFAMALKMAETSEVRKRIMQSEIQLDVYEWYLERAKLEETGEGTLERKEAEGALRAAGKKLYGKALSFGITHMAEGCCMVTAEPDFLTPPTEWGWVKK